MTTFVIFMGIFLVGALVVAFFGGRGDKYNYDTASNKNGMSYHKDKNVYCGRDY